MRTYLLALFGAVAGANKVRANPATTADATYAPTTTTHDSSYDTNSHWTTALANCEANGGEYNYYTFDYALQDFVEGDPEKGECIYRQTWCTDE